MNRSEMMKEVLCFNLEDLEILKMVKKQLRRERNRLNSKLKTIEQHEQTKEIEKNIENREKMMTYDLKEMIIRVMEKRKEQIKIDSCQQVYMTEYG